MQNAISLIVHNRREYIMANFLLYVISLSSFDSYVTMQQTPKELAQFPSADPRDEHSVDVMQTPFRPVVEVAEHSLKYTKILACALMMIPSGPFYSNMGIQFSELMRNNQLNQY